MMSFCRERGFTLIEVMVTLALLAAMVAAAVPMRETLARRAHEQALRRTLREIRTAIDAYKQASDDGRIEKTAGQSGYPPSLSVLAEGVADQTDTNGAMMIFLRRLPRDPLCGCPTRTAEQTWRIRPYSEHDVYDVASTRQEEGLDGIAYDQW